MITEIIRRGDSCDSLSDDSGLNSGRDSLYRVKTHHNISDFGCLKMDDVKHVGLEEVSPLEGTNGKLKE